MDRQRAEAHLQLLVEEELRRPAWQWGERRLRVERVALLLTAMGALDDEVADRILADFDLALVARQTDAPGRGGVAAVSWRRSPVVVRPAMPVSSQSSASGPILGRLVPLGQVIPLRAEPAGGEVYLLSYAQTDTGPQLSLFLRATRGSATSSRCCRRPARCRRSARCLGSSPRYAAACVSPTTASPPRPPVTCPNLG